MNWNLYVHLQSLKNFSHMLGKFWQESTSIKAGNPAPGESKISKKSTASTSRKKTATKVTKATKPDTRKKILIKKSTSSASNKKKGQ
ncbi:MAG: hypothetical protein ACKVHQ_05395 [Gammaproteobacteria bacterium]